MSPSKKPAVSRKKIPSLLTLGLDHKLLGYAAAAGAAGVSLLALAQPSQAEIVYTATHQTLSQGGSLAIDLNNDGITDFTIHNIVSICSSGPSCVLQNLVVTPNAPNRVWATKGIGNFAQALSADRKVGPGDKFGSFVFMDRCKATRTSFYLSGSWPEAKNRYLGLAFSIDGQTHFGWARLTVFVKGRGCAASAILTGYAYETEGGKPIATGKKSGTDEANSGTPPAATLGALALGSAGFVAWRRDEEAESSKF